MTPEHKKEIQIQVLEYQARNQKSDAQMATTLNISPAYMHHIKAGTYDNMPVGNSGKTSQISETIWRKIADRVGWQVKLVETENYKTIFYHLTVAKQRPINRIIDGPTGAGKSEISREFVRKYGGPNTFYIRCHGDYTAREVMVDLAQTVNVLEEGKTSKLRAAVTRKLMEMDGIPVLIIDEAENLPIKAYDAIKSLCDDLQGRISIILIGANEYLQMLITKGRKGTGCIPQIVRRFRSRPVKLKTMKEADDLGRFCHAFGITKNSAKDKLRLECPDYGTLRNTIDEVLQEASIKGISPEDIDAEFIKETLAA